VDRNAGGMLSAPVFNLHYSIADSCQLLALSATAINPARCLVPGPPGKNRSISRQRSRRLMASSARSFSLLLALLSHDARSLYRLNRIIFPVLNNKDYATCDNLRRLQNKQSVEIREICDFGLRIDLLLAIATCSLHLSYLTYTEHVF
jgi:hypothetical protein